MPLQSDPDRMPHPGRTSAERRALDRIDCGEPPACAQKMLAAGLIVEAGSQTRHDAPGKYKIPNFEMPIPVHMPGARPLPRPTGRWRLLRSR